MHYGTNIWNYDYGYDSTGRAMTFHDQAYNRDSRYLFDESGRIIKAYNSNDTSTFYEYDAAGNTTQVRMEKSGQVVSKLRYDYDANGNVSKIWSDMDGTWIEYTYDSLGQLLQEKDSSNHIEQYQYDEMGNRTKVINDGVTTAYTYNPEKNRLVLVGSKNYKYDANGNVIDDGTNTYVWGDDNKLKEVDAAGSAKASFTYDALGRRDTMTAGGVTKTFHYDGDLVSYITDSAGKVYLFAYNQSGHPVFMSYNGNQ